MMKVGLGVSADSLVLQVFPNTRSTPKPHVKAGGRTKSGLSSNKYQDPKTKQNQIV